MNSDFCRVPLTEEGLQAQIPQNGGTGLSVGNVGKRSCLYAFQCSHDADDRRLMAVESSRTPSVCLVSLPKPLEHVDRRLELAGFDLAVA